MYSEKKITTILQDKNDEKAILNQLYNLVNLINNDIFTFFTKSSQHAFKSLVNVLSNMKSIHI